MPHVVRLILTGRQPRHFAGLRNLMNINEVQWSNGDTRRYLVVEWCALGPYSPPRYDTCISPSKFPDSVIDLIRQPIT